MKILTVCYEYPPIGGGGGRVAASVADELARRGHQVRMQTSGLSGLSSREISPQGVDIQRVFSFRGSADACTVPQMAGYVLANVWPVLRATQKWKPDVLHAHFAVPTGPVVWLAHKLTGVPYVLTAHLGDVPGGAPEQTDHLFRMVKPFTKPIWNDASRITAVSSHVAELARRAYGVNARIIPNGIESVAQHVPPSDPDGLVRLLFVGRMSVQKNPIFLADVLAPLRGKHWRAVFIGDGPLRPELERQLQRAGIEGQCELRGWLDNSDVRAAMARSDILIMPSLSEGMPVAAVEAASLGLAIAGSNIPGLSDILHDGVNGWTLPLGDSAPWTKLLGSILEDRTFLRERQENSLRVARGFDLAGIISSYEDVLLSALHK